MRSSRPAYTLIEISLVLTLLVVVASLAYPSIDLMYRGMRVRAGADAIRTACTLARVHAMDEGETYRVAFVPSRGNYRVAPDNSSYWSGGDTQPEASDPAHPPLVHEEVLARGVFLWQGHEQHPTHQHEIDLPVGLVGKDQWVTLALFLPDGTAEADAEVSVCLEGAPSLVLQLRALTGIASIQQVGAEKKP